MGVYPIRTVAQLTGLTQRQVRYYEAMHLVAPVRSNGNQRLYSSEDVDLLMVAKALHDQGMTLQGVRLLMQAGTLSSMPIAEIQIPKLNHGSLIKALSEGKTLGPESSGEQQSIYQFLRQRWEYLSAP